MEQIVQLDTNDDVASVKSKLQTLKPGPAALEVPKGNRALRGPIAMRILKREALDLALDLSIVSESQAIRHSGQQQGFAVYGSVESYERNAPRRRRPTGRLQDTLPTAWGKASMTATVALIATLTVVALAAVYILLPSTTVVLVPVSQKIQETLEITADPDVKAINLEKALVPARVVYVRAQGSEQLKATGKKSSNESRATGEITLTNRTQNEVTVPKGTVAKTDKGEKFTTNQEVKLAAGNQSNGKVGVVAVQQGSSGNVSRGEINRLEGTLDSQVSVFNELPTANGGASDVAVVTEEDRTKVKETLQQKLEKEVMTKLEAERQKTETLSTESIRVVPLRTDYDKDTGQESSVVNLDMELRANGTFYNTADVEAVIKAWSPRLKTGYYLRQETIKAGTPKVVEAEGGTVRMSVDIEGIVASRINEDRVRDAIRWKTTDDAKQWLTNSLILAKEPEIKVSPGWATRAFRINVTIVNPDGSGSQ